MTGPFSAFKKSQFTAWIDAICGGTEARFIHLLFGLYSLSHRRDQASMRRDRIFATLPELAEKRWRRRLPKKIPPPGVGTDEQATLLENDHRPRHLLEVPLLKPSLKLPEADFEK